MMTGRYAHYWHRVPSLDEEGFRLLSESVRALIAADPTFSSQESTEAIRGWDGTGCPVLTDETIELNGNAMHDLHHETFTLHRDLSITDLIRNGGNNAEHLHWDYVITAKKPYDQVVVATLLFAAYYLNSGIFDIHLPGTTFAFHTTEAAPFYAMLPKVEETLSIRGEYERARMAQVLEWCVDKSPVLQGP